MSEGHDSSKFVQYNDYVFGSTASCPKLIVKTLIRLQTDFRFLRIYIKIRDISMPSLPGISSFLSSSFPVCSTSFFSQILSPLLPRVK